MVRRSIAGVVSVAEDTHMADRAGGASGYAHVNDAGHNKNDDSQEPDRHIRHVIGKHQVRENYYAAKGYKQEQCAERRQNGGCAVSATHRTVEHEWLLVCAVSL